MRPSWVEVDLAAVATNVAALGRLIAPSELWAVVKADGYGHGDVPVALAALDAGASGLCVALVEEGVRLRESGVECPILVLSEPAVTDIHAVIEWSLIPTVYRHSFLEALNEFGVSCSPALKVDTGMHRVGAPSEIVVELGRRALQLGFDVHSIWTHFAVAEDDEDGFTSVQLQRYEECCAELERIGLHGFKRHLANTAGGILHPASRGDMVRVGLGIYGLHPSPACAEAVSLRQAIRVVSHVTLTRRLRAGERPSYGRRRPLPHDSTVVTVPIGYADGVPRILSNRHGEVLIGGVRHPLAGTVTMDQIMVDVGDHDVAIGDEVVLLGGQGSEFISVDEWAEKVDTISYEIVSRLGPRLPRRYTE